MILKYEFDTTLILDAFHQFLTRETCIGRHADTSTNLIDILHRLRCITGTSISFSSIQQDLTIAEDRAGMTIGGRALERHIVDELLRIVTCHGTTVGIHIVVDTHTLWVNIDRTVLTIDRVTPDRTVVQDSLLQTWVTVLIRLLIVIARIAVVDGVPLTILHHLVGVHQILRWVSTAIGLVRTTVATR